MPPADPNAPNRLPSDAYLLSIRQAPERAKVVGPKDKASDRKPVDPPPVVQLRIRDLNDPAQNYLQSPYYFMCCVLWDPREDKAAAPPPGDSQSCLAGTIASSLHRLKDPDNTDGGFFVFGDLSVRVEGEFRLQFCLFELMQGQAVCLASIVSQPFTVYSAKLFPGMSESTFLSRSFGDQGVRLRIRKETRAQKRPTSRGQGSQDMQQYGTPGRSSTGTNPTSATYSTNSGYGPPRPEYPQEYPEPPGKRQRSAGPGGIKYEGRPGQDPWGYSQAPGIYPQHGQQPSTFSQDTLTYRPPPDNSLNQSPYMQQNSTQYGDPQRIPQPLSMNRSYGSDQIPDMNNIREPYYQQPPDQTRGTRYSAPGASNMLPPIGTTSAANAGASVIQTSPTYNSLPPAENRYGTNPQNQGNVPREYNGYSASGYSVPTSYIS